MKAIGMPKKIIAKFEIPGSILSPSPSSPIIRKIRTMVYQTTESQINP